MSYGEIRVSWSDDQVASIKGWISWPGIDLNFWLKPLKYEQGKGDKDPSHQLLAANARGSVINAGVAWRETVQNGDNKGRPMWSLSFDLPHFQQPLRLHAFEMRGEPQDTRYTIDWRRQRGGHS